MAALNWSQCPAVESIPGKVSGAWVFKGTRTPVALVFENLALLLPFVGVAQQLDRDSETALQLQPTPA